MNGETNEGRESAGLPRKGDFDLLLLPFCYNHLRLSLLNERYTTAAPGRTATQRQEYLPVLDCHYERERE